MKDTIIAKRWDYVPDEYIEVGVKEIYDLICNKDNVNLFTMLVSYNKSENNMIYEILPVAKDETGLDCTLYDILYSKSISGDFTDDQIRKTINFEIKNMIPIWVDGDVGSTYLISFKDETHTTLISHRFDPANTTSIMIGRTGTLGDTKLYKINSPCHIDYDGSLYIYIFNLTTLMEEEKGVLFLR